MLVIQYASYELYSALESFEEFDYGSSLDQSFVQCLLKQFFDIFIEERKDVVKSVFQLQDEVEILLDMASTFRNKQILFCRRGKFTGCEAELNKLRCELLEFFKGLKKVGHQAEIDLRGLDDTCYDLGKMARKFMSRNYLTCSPPQLGSESSDDQDNLQNDIRSMFPDFKESHDDGRVKLDDLSGLCDNLSADIDTWIVKVA